MAARGRDLPPWVHSSMGHITLLLHADMASFRSLTTRSMPAAQQRTPAPAHPSASYAKVATLAQQDMSSLDDMWDPQEVCSQVILFRWGWGDQIHSCHGRGCCIRCASKPHMPHVQACCCVKRLRI